MSKDPKAKYDHSKLEEKIKEVIKGAKLKPKEDPEKALPESPENLTGCCMMFLITTFQDSGDELYFMRTFVSNPTQLGPESFSANFGRLYEQLWRLQHSCCLSKLS